MRLTVRGVLADAWALWRRDHDLLVRIAAPLLFLPTLATQLLAPSPPVSVMLDCLLAQSGDKPSALCQAIADQQLPYLLAGLIAQLGVAALTVFYCDRAATDVAGALRRGMLLWPRFVIAAIVVKLLTIGGFFVLFVGAAVVAGRVLLTGPLIAATQRVSAVGAVARSVRATAGYTLPLAGLGAVALLAGPIAAQPFVTLEAWLRGHAPNPVALAVVDVAMAGAAMLGAIAGVLIAVAAYRALAGAARRGM